VVTFLAVIHTSGPTVPTGTVTFGLDGTVLGEVAVDADGKAALSEALLRVGTHAVTATYSGDGDVAPASAGMTHTTRAQTSTTIVAVPNPSEFGEPFTLVATVRSAAAGVPTGAVRFTVGQATLGTVELEAAGSATLMASPPGAGQQAVLACYAGDAHFAPSSAALTQTVNRARTTISVAAATGYPTRPHPAATNGSAHHAESAGGHPSGSQELD
jgi:hypothetical protein